MDRQIDTQKDRHTENERNNDCGRGRRQTDRQIDRQRKSTDRHIDR